MAEDAGADKVQQLSESVSQEGPGDVDAAESGMSEASRRELRQTELLAFRSHSGPLPPPHELAEYDKISPGLAERIIKMAETQAEHRQALEKEVIHNDIRNSHLGMWLGFCVAVLGLSASIALGVAGEGAAASVIGGGTLVSMVSVFVYGAAKRQQERESAE